MRRRFVSQVSKHEPGTATSSLPPPRTPSFAPSRRRSAPTGPKAHLRRWIGSRYRLDEELGRGGMAVVYLATDMATGRRLALKQLNSFANGSSLPQAIALFEREYHTLAELSHPRVIHVFDYGVDEQGPFYTMDLLDGGDLRDLAPLPWKQACKLIYDVASSLALIHARGLVHRDVSPGNVRCTAKGEGRLIDFGAMTRVQACDDVVGTPSFIAPECVKHEVLNARTDLFSVGATLYYALTGRAPYPARAIDELPWHWNRKPPPPSAHDERIPAALDRLVMSLIQLDPVMRLPSAFATMQHLSAIAEIRDPEPINVASAYLTSPMLVSRRETREALRRRLVAARERHGSAIRLEAKPGMGRSRMLEACLLDAKTRGLAVVGSAARDAGQQPFGVAQALAQQLLEALPEAAVHAASATDGVRDALFERDSAVAPKLVLLQRSTLDHATLQAALSAWFLEVSRRRPLLVAVDDVHRIDEPSMALLAQLADKAAHEALVVLGTQEQLSEAPTSTPLHVFGDRSEAMVLDALDRAQTDELLRSVFGDVPNLALLSGRVHELADGNPRECMDVLRYLIDHGVIRYDKGGWTLPTSLTSHELPASAQEAFLTRVDALSPLARRILETMALATYGAFSWEECVVLFDDIPTREVDAALAELVNEHMAHETHVYGLVHGMWAGAIAAKLSDGARAARHRDLARLYERTGKPDLAIARHQLLAGLEEPALQRIVSLVENSDYRDELLDRAEMSALETADVLATALDSAQRLQRPVRQVVTLLRGLALVGTASDDRYYWMGAPQWRTQLEHDSGLVHWRALSHERDAMQRLTLALQKASEEYEATPPDKRGYTPTEAIRLLAHYVVASFSIGASSQNAKLLASLPELLEPFTPLSPVLEAIWHNAVATHDAAVACRYEQARERWLGVLKRLDELDDVERQLASAARYGVYYGIGATEGRLGLASVIGWAERLDDAPTQRVNGMYLRRIASLQNGDWKGAEHFRKEAELIALQAKVRQLFTNTVSLQLGVQVLADDLAGVKQSADRIEPLADRYPGWVPYRFLARAHFERMRGNLNAALEAVRQCLSLCDPDSKRPETSLMAWPWASAAHVLTLVEMGRYADAMREGERALRTCKRLEIGMASHETARAVALAEGKLGTYDAAARRLEKLIAEQRKLGVTGLNLGASYEARTRVAIWAGDTEAVETYAELTAREYRHGNGSALGARYERLMEEARAAGARDLPSLPADRADGRGVGAMDITRELARAPDATARAERALALLCEAFEARGGHLFLATQDGDLRHAATHPAHTERPPSLQPLVYEHFHAQLRSDFDATVLVDESEPAPGIAHQGGTSPRGTHGSPYRPFLLQCEVNGIPLQLGVVALAVEAHRSPKPSALQIVTLVAGQLWRHGDATGSTALPHA